MPSVAAAAVYARISSDQEGTALGVKRQLQDCRQLAKHLGWAIGEEYVDNDLSAFSGKRRPAYERMLGDLAEGTRDAVLVYHADRLTRRPIELEHFLEVISAAKVRHVRFVAGADVDVGNGDGLMVLRMLSAVAANESASKSRRMRRKLDEVAASGRPHGGGRHRPFGYEDDRITVRRNEAAIIRKLVARYLAGESLRSLATWLDQQGIRTVGGGPWRTPTLRAMLASPRIAGLRQHRGRTVGPAIWKPIISKADHLKVTARVAERTTSGRRTPRRYLLTGLLRCGRCSNGLYSSPRFDTRRYVCLSGPDHGGCGRLSVTALPLEELIVAGVLFRLDTPELADRLAGRLATDEHTAAMAEQLAEDRAQLDELAELYGTRQIAAREWLAARKAIEARVRDAERHLARASRADALAGLAGNGKQLRRQWADLNLTRQNAIVASVLDHAIVAPTTTPGIRYVDPERIDPVWRL